MILFLLLILKYSMYENDLTYICCMLLTVWPTLSRRNFYFYYNLSIIIYAYLSFRTLSFPPPTSLSLVFRQVSIAWTWVKVNWILTLIMWAFWGLNLKVRLSCMTPGSIWNIQKWEFSGSHKLASNSDALLFWNIWKYMKYYPL